MAAVKGLREVRESILVSYVCDVIYEEEFVILTELNMSEELYLIGISPYLILIMWDDQRCQTELRFRKAELFELKDVLRLPEKIVTVQRTICTEWKGYALC